MKQHTHPHRKQREPLLLPLVDSDDPILSKVALEVEFDPETNFVVKEAVDGMWKTLRRIGGAGLAAPQVGLGLRIILLNTKDLNCAVVNPTFTPHVTDTKWSKQEGCLSYPGLLKDVKRYKDVILNGYDIEGNALKPQRCRGFTAFAVQHEIDHLNGITLGNR